MVSLGERIETWRKAKKLTQEDLANAIDVTPSAISLWESDKTAPSQKHLEIIVNDEFGLTMERFYGPLPKVA